MARFAVAASWLLTSFLSVAAIAAGATVATRAPPDDPTALRDLVATLDREMFDAYNAHDIDRLMPYFAEDLEFFHDTDGLSNFGQTRTGLSGVFANNPDIRRALVPGSLEVYPVKNYGAIEIGAHEFCHTENGKPDCGTFNFVHVWRYADGRWTVARVVSYGH
jgi:ketosteroid isomerase-like protein